MSQQENAPEQALAWVDAGKGAALATVVETWGSAPRPVGAQLVVAGSGEMEGSVSGGCVEGAVVIEALEALEEGSTRLLEYGVSDGDAFAVGLACGGTIRILVEPIGDGGMPEAMLRDLVAARAARQLAAYEVALDGSARQLHWGAGADGTATGLNPDGNSFVARHAPPLRLIMVGGVHIAQMLSTLARPVGFDPIVVDPRAAFGSEARFPDVRLVSEWPDEAVQQIGLDPGTAVVLLTHDPKLDDPALHEALRSDCFYIGALGSRRTHAARLERLRAAGFDEGQLALIHGPVGLNIGAVGAAEIAVSILAEIIQTLRQA